jgi:hypothetical protein
MLIDGAENEAKPMNIDEFWEIVERVHLASPGDMEAKCQLLDDELRTLAPKEIKSFAKHFHDCFYKSYTWDVLGAAFVINHGCGDDSFMDFRSTLISLGRAPFEAAMSDADSLADFDIDPAWARFEGYQYVAGTVYQEVQGHELSSGNDGTKFHPEELLGTPFKPWQLSGRFPRLAAKYDYKDADWFNEKEQEEKQVNAEEMGEKIKTILLESGIIPSCGLIPPPRIVAEILKTGQSPELSGRSYSWPPFEYDERFYWSAVAILEKTNTGEITTRPDLKGKQLRLDLNTAGAGQFDQWIESLKQRELI